MLHKRPFVVAVSLLATVTTAFAADRDNDGVIDTLDNCFEVANADQADRDGDLYGNACDADINNDGQVEFFDLQVMKLQFFVEGESPADINDDGIVDFGDLNQLKVAFFTPPGPSGPAAAAASIQLVDVFTQIDLNQPMFLRQPVGVGRPWYVGERAGRIVWFDNVAEPDVTRLFLDITDRVDTTFEGGLLGMAFDPDYDNNGRVFVSYTASGSGGDALQSRVSMFTPDETDPTVLDPASEVVIIRIGQPSANHNGGDVAFGHDGYLYYGLGDGGGSGDSSNQAQNVSTLLGAMLRLDVNVSEEDIDNDITYRIPPDNPFAGSADCSTGCPEIYAWGLRNPYRFGFDSKTGELYAGDVGQSSREEIDLIVNGGNYGWRCFEGNQTFNTSGCQTPSEYIFPLVDYPRSLGTTVTGGYVYHGSAMPALRGVYFYGDYGSGRIWGLLGDLPVGTGTGEFLNTNVAIVAFWEANDGEMYVVGLNSNSIHRIEAD